MDTIKEITKIVAKQMETDESKIQPAQSFQEQGVDELDHIEIIMRLEEQFGIEITDEQAAHITTIAQAAEYINQRKN